MSEQYKHAGVDIEAGYKAVERMKTHVEKTMRPEVMSSLGGFGGAFDLSRMNLKHPVLVSGTDGVGTKLKLAIDNNKHDTIGIDAVAMCVNDIITTGAEPLYFLDYLALHKVIPEQVERIVKGIAEGCVQAECALIGGETAEMRDMYAKGEYDIAGFAVGAVEKEKYITGDRTQRGDVIIGLPSSGIHSNGYTLVRKIIQDENISLNDQMGGETILDLLMEPTKIYVKPIKHVLRTMDVKAMSHITGGGFIENIPRAIPEHLGVNIDTTKIKVPPIINYLIDRASMDAREAYNVFNMGIGFVLIVDPSEVDGVMHALKASGERPLVIGEVTTTQGVTLDGI